MDNRLKQLAKNIVDYSLEMQSGETLLLTAVGEVQFELASAIMEYCQEKNIGVISECLTVKEYDARWEGIDRLRLDEIINREKQWYADSDATCILKTTENFRPLNNEESKLFAEYMNVIHIGIRIKRRWCLTGVPSSVSAKVLNLPHDQLYDFYLNASSIDYNALSLAQDQLVSFIKKTDKVHILSKGTDLTFSIKGLPPIKCMGKRNIPDGEVYTAPVKNSINGCITYNVPSQHNGILHENIRLEFKNGKIINASSSHTKELNEVFDIDEGARYVGEFAFGLNPLVTMPCNDVLYDEKISGSIHLTPGGCYERCNNGNHSSLHWDLVQIQTPEYGGGEIWFDDVLIRKDGLFVPKALQCLNPDQLLKNLDPIRAEEK